MLRKNLIKILAVVFIFGASSASLQASNDHGNKKNSCLKKIKHKKNVLEFDDAEIIFEQNATDGDVEVVIFAKLEASDAGMQQFWLCAPNGKEVYKFSSPKKNNNIGGREIVVESPEPGDTSIVFGAYPEGTYTFVAKSFDKEWFLSEADLSHELPDVKILLPVEDSVVSRGFYVTWMQKPPSEDTPEKFIVELVNEGSEEPGKCSDLEEELVVDVPGDQNMFQTPFEWMEAGCEYQVSVGIVNEFGNKTSRELNVKTSTAP
jgi:hypothetical protein